MELDHVEAFLAIARSGGFTRGSAALRLSQPATSRRIKLLETELGAPLFDRLALVMLGVFPFIIMFLITSVAMLRERTTGTLERLLTTPLGKLDLLFGYGIAFGLVAAGQAAITTGLAYWLLDLDTAGNPGWASGGGSRPRAGAARGPPASPPGSPPRERAARPRRRRAHARHSAARHTVADAV